MGSDLHNLHDLYTFARASLAVLTLLVGQTAAEPIRGSVTLQDGRRLQYAYHFDRNALRDCVRVGDSLLALTESGELLRFDIGSLALTGQRIVPGRATAIAVRDSDHVLIGTRQGVIFEAEAASLDLRRVATVSGQILWLGSGPDMIVAAADRLSYEVRWPGEDVRDFEARVGTGDHSYFVALIQGRAERFFDLPSGKAAVEPYAVLLEGATRLWLGEDRGEFGGSCSWMDLRSGKLRRLRGKPNVRGFLQTRDGRVLAYGGTSHFGYNSGEIVRVDRQKLEYLSEFKGGEYLDPAKPEAPQLSGMQNMPQGPVDLVQEDPSGNGFLVVSEHILYKADRNFGGWEKIAELGGRWRSGHVYAVGDTPTVKAAIPDRRSGNWIFAMGRDGFVRVSDGTVRRNQMPAQVEVSDESSLVDIWPTSIGLLLLEAPNPYFCWRLKADGWERLSFYPARPPTEPAHHWMSAVPYGDDGRGILAQVGDNTISGERVLLRLGPQGVTELKAWEEDALYHDAFQTVDGKIFLIPGNELLVWEGESWRKAGEADRPFGFETAYGRRYISCAKVGSTEFFHDVGLGGFVRLDVGSDNTYRLEAVTFPKDTTPGPAFDAVPDGSGHVLLAAVRGLFRWAPADNRFERLADPEPAGRILTICRDSRGRLWAAGDRLHLSGDSGQQWETVDLPMLCRSDTKRIRPNPERQDGLILLLHDQGMVYLDW